MYQRDIHQRHCAFPLPAGYKYDETFRSSHNEQAQKVANATHQASLGMRWVNGERLLVPKYMSPEISDDEIVGESKVLHVAIPSNRNQQLVLLGTECKDHLNSFYI
ncbi:hypothetical protein BDB00DRAFT_788347 [Zychaea mexicana]|uniref:uncharacterized protein n=1 Tax=Zychaea mexicana TaxID=64656 RepID=UPI0022FEBD97|nr:uncharacterized protein BDB00DRAFT_788347 [Zychaea mexicana]KAI9493003.1 hypothetical protein BDB00DRAFT_788347 [Zychaea mexicana]